MSLIVIFTGSLKDTFRVVFLKLPWPLGREALCDWSRSSKELQKVMHLVVYLKLPGVGEVVTLRVSMWECATKLGTLNSKIPSLSNVV